MLTPSLQFSQSLKGLHREIDQGQKSEAELVTHFVLIHLQNKEPAGRWLGSRKNSYPPVSARFSPRKSGVSAQLRSIGIIMDDRLERRLEGCANLVDLLSAYQFKGVRQDSQDGLLGWLENRYPLHLRFDVPSALEMLEAQCEGERYVTLFTDSERQFEPIGRHADALAFLLHDLEHAHKFFGDPYRFRGQVSFFKHIRAILNAGLLTELTADERFANELAYLISDMNSHPLHLFKYLKAIILDVFKRWDADLAEFDELLLAVMEHWQWSKPLQECGMRINTPGKETPIDAEIITEYWHGR